MSNLNNIIMKNKRFKNFKKRKSKTLLLEKSPQKKGIVFKKIIMTPRKPNSAKRKIYGIKLFCNERYTFCYIPGFELKLNKFAQILVRGGNTKDLPGVKLKAIRGIKDVLPDLKRRRSYSKYGIKSKYFRMFKLRYKWKINKIIYF